MLGAMDCPSVWGFLCAVERQVDIESLKLFSPRPDGWESHPSLFKLSMLQNTFQAGDPHYNAGHTLVFKDCCIYFI